jgi:hypothetical protein
MPHTTKRVTCPPSVPLPPQPRSEERLDFSYYEHRNYAKFVPTVARTLDFITEHKNKTGFAPNGAVFLGGGGYGGLCALACCV